MPHNIERSGFRRGEYVGYASDGRPGVYRIRRRAGGGGWYAARYVGGLDAGGGYLFGRTLALLSSRL